MSLHCTLPCELRSGDFLEPADLWECSLGFSKNSEVFLVGKNTLSINSCAHYLLGLTATLIVFAAVQYRRLQNVCNRKVKSEKATAFLIWMILLFSVVRLTTISEQSEPRFCFSVAYRISSIRRRPRIVAALE